VVTLWNTVATFVRNYTQDRGAWRVLNYPLYIPERDAEIRKLLLSGDISELMRVLERRASLGSGWAAALLGFLRLRGAPGGSPDPKLAESTCLDAARAGEPFAQYVLAWALWERGEYGPAIRWMKPAALDGEFLPALVDGGRFLATLAARGLVDMAEAVEFLWDAHRLGHLTALLFIAEFFRRGHLGIARKALGVLIFPYAVARAAVAMHCASFSARVFVNMFESAEHPLFESRQGHQ